MGYITQPPGVFETKLLHVQDQKPSGTAGGSSVVGYNIRDLNKILVNEIGASLAANQITLPAGDYFMLASAPLWVANSNYTQLRLYNVTDAAFITKVDGTSQRVSHDAVANCGGRFSLSVTSTLELRQLNGQANATVGLGYDVSSAGTIDHNVFADLKVWKLS